MQDQNKQSQDFEDRRIKEIKKRVTPVIIAVVVIEVVVDLVILTIDIPQWQMITFLSISILFSTFIIIWIYKDIFYLNYQKVKRQQREINEKSK